MNNKVKLQSTNIDPDGTQLINDRVLPISPNIKIKDFDKLSYHHQQILLSHYKEQLYEFKLNKNNKSEIKSVNARLMEKNKLFIK